MNGPCYGGENHGSWRLSYLAHRQQSLNLNSLPAVTGYRLILDLSLSLSQWCFIAYLLGWKDVKSQFVFLSTWIQGQWLDFFLAVCSTAGGTLTHSDPGMHLPSGLLEAACFVCFTIYLFVSFPAVPGLPCCVDFSLAEVSGGHSPVAVYKPLIVWLPLSQGISLRAHRLQWPWLPSSGAQAP